MTQSQSFAETDKENLLYQNVKENSLILLRVFLLLLLCIFQKIW